MIFKKPLRYLLLAGIAIAAITIYFVSTPAYIKPNNTAVLTQNSSDIETITIISERYMFSPTLIPLKKGKSVKLVLTTVDVQHGISLPDLNINLSAYPGRSAETIITPQKVGEFTTNCSLYCGKDHNKMKMTFMVYE